MAETVRARLCSSPALSLFLSLSLVMHFQRVRLLCLFRKIRGVQWRQLRYKVPAPHRTRMVSRVCRPLTHEQLLYAATDAQAGVLVFARMVASAEAQCF